MSHFVIAGKNDCPNLAHVLHVAQHLHTHLPKFKYRAITMTSSEWQMWLDRMNQKHRWSLSHGGPIIWKEITRSGGKPYLIGGIGEFWEYCYDYYGILSRIPKDQLRQIVADDLFIKSKELTQTEFRNISIIGAASKIVELIIFELQSLGPNMLINLYEDEDADDPSKEEFLLNVVDDIKPILTMKQDNLKIVTTLKDAIKDCDLLMIINDFTRHGGETWHEWLYRCASYMRLISEEINMFGKRSLRVILSHPGPVCFNASVMMEFCTTIRLANIVAVTAHEGLAAISFAGEKSDVSIDRMGCAPVWGFCGISSFVDVGGIITKSAVLRPFQRSLTTTVGNEVRQLPKGQVKWELRLLSYVLDNEDKLRKLLIQKKKSYLSSLQRPPLLARVRATASLIKLWLSPEPHDNVISLGVCSNGSFEFPCGVVFSQPVVLNERNIWEPLTNFPISKTARSKISDILLSISDVLESFGLGHHVN